MILLEGNINLVTDNFPTFMMTMSLSVDNFFFPASKLIISLCAADRKLVPETLGRFPDTFWFQKYLTIFRYFSEPSVLY